MYETIKNKVISAFTLKRVICGVLSIISIYFACSLIGGYLDTRADYQRTRVSSWNELKGRLMKAESSINNSEKALQQANSLTATQGTALTELKIINEERTKELNALKAINEKQGQELTKASNLLTTQEAKLNEASTSLEELTEQIKRNKRTEQRLKRQRDTWAVVSGVFGLAGAIRR